jgi:hypothetical protein
MPSFRMVHRDPIITERPKGPAGGPETSSKPGPRKNFISPQIPVKNPGLTGRGSLALVSDGPGTSAACVIAQSVSLFRRVHSARRRDAFLMPRHTRTLIWAGWVAAVTVLAGLAWYLSEVGLDQAGKVVAPVGLMVGVATLFAPYLLPTCQQLCSKPAPLVGLRPPAWRRRDDHRQSRQRRRAAYRRATRRRPQSGSWSRAPLHPDRLSQPVHLLPAGRADRRRDSHRRADGWRRAMRYAETQDGKAHVRLLLGAVR